MAEERYPKIAEFNLTSLVGTVEIKPPEHGPVVLNETRYKLNKPITGDIEKEGKFYYVVWRPNPAGKSKLEQGSPIVGAGESLQPAFDEFLDDLIASYELTIQTPGKEWHPSARDYTNIMKSMISKN